MAVLVVVVVLVVDDAFRIDLRIETFDKILLKNIYIKLSKK